MSSSSIFPSQTLPQKDKTPEWCSTHLDYAQYIWMGSNTLRYKMDADFRSYNGDKTPESIKYLTKNYGKENKSKYVSYRAHKPKIQLMVGEFLTQPLVATVETTNRDAKTEKMDKMNMMYGAMVARPELEHLRDKVGVDVMQGAPVPESEEDPLWDRISVKDKQETIMQIILDEMIKQDDLKIKFSNDVLNGTITSMMFGKVERDEEGETSYISIDPRNAIFQEIQGDTFLEKSPIMGSCIYYSVHDVLRRFNLTEDQVKLLNSAAQNPQFYLTRPDQGFRMIGQNLMVQVMHIEWKSVIPTYYKRLTKTANQLLLDNSDPYIYQPMDTEEYENNKDWHDSQVKKGKYEIVPKWAEDLWEATRIGGLPELDVNRRRALFQMRKVDDPTRIFGGSYTGCLIQTVDGKRISLMNDLENLSNAFDIVMYKILQEINKYKGIVLGYNAAALPAKSSMKEIAYNIINDGFVIFDTSATGNAHGRDVSLNNLLDSKDIGLSSSFPFLIQEKRDLLNMMSEMTGINENREGNVAASATVTNTNESITASRTITAPFFYATHLYVSKVLSKIVESTKVTWGFYKVEKGEQILGTGKFKWLQVTQDIGFRDYGVHIQDGSRYNQINQFMTGLMEASLNAKEITQGDALKFMIAESFSEKKAIFEAAEERVKAMAQEGQQAQMANQQQMQQAQLQQQLEIANANREDMQKNEKDNIILQGEVDIKVNAAAAGNKITENAHKIEAESLRSDNI